MPFKANADRWHHIPRQKFRVTNWREYDASLRGRLTVWFTEEAIRAWKAEPRTTRGGQPTYSGLAILTALTLRAVFRLALRQTGGADRFRRAPARARPHRARPFHAEPPGRDGAGAAATSRLRDRPPPPAGGQHGLKLCGAGEWLHEKHGTKVRRS